MQQKLILLIFISLLSGCAGHAPIEEQDAAPKGYVDVSKIPDAVPKYEPYSRYGNPDSYEVFGKRYSVQESAEGHVERGIASWYGTKFHGRRTSSGETYDMYKMTAAHKNLPLPTYAEVTNLDNGRKIIVKINDRGPFKVGRIIDLSYTAAIKLGIDQKGTGNVEVRAITVAADEPEAVAQAIPLAMDQIEKLPPPRRAATTSQIYLQVGSFGERDNMQRMLDRLLNSNIDNVVIHQPSDHQPLYRLRIGPLADRQDAERLTSQLQQMGFDKPYIVVVD
ncbi:Septum-associated rare lipoprotein A [hydrothermal vent metagenome]|uniref:Septum-associated rare lipoprotein A n=1 Tax=hydrothermal vent metagenome TaxID=652676 RepID=A0A3B1A2A1_9ZZZZ